MRAAACQTRHDDGVELQPLGLVDSHDLHPRWRDRRRYCLRAGLRLGLGIQLGQLLAQGIQIFGLTTQLGRLEKIQIDRSVSQITGVLAAGRTRQRQPGRFDLLAQTAACARRQQGMQRLHQARNSRLPILRQLGHMPGLQQ